MNAAYDRQASAWAIDRAIEILKSSKEAFTPQQVIATANTLCEWMFPKPDEPEPELDEMEKQDAANIKAAQGETVQ